MEVGDVRMTRLRLLHVLVQPVFVIDDGDELKPAPEVQTTTVTLSGLAAFPDEILASIPKLEAQVLGPGLPPEAEELQDPDED